MIIYQCDACFTQKPHEGPNLPPGWAGIVATVRWMETDSELGSDQECTARLMCGKCRGNDQEKLCLDVERILSRGLDQRPTQGA